MVGLTAFTTLIPHRGKHINTVWMIIAPVYVYCIAYRFYSLYIAKNILQLDANQLTPAEHHNNGLDYVSTHKGVPFGQHFATIAGAGCIGYINGLFLVWYWLVPYKILWFYLSLCDIMVNHYMILLNKN